MVVENRRFVKNKSSEITTHCTMFFTDTNVKVIILYFRFSLEQSSFDISVFLVIGQFFPDEMEKC